MYVKDQRYTSLCMITCIFPMVPLYFIYRIVYFPLKKIPYKPLLGPKIPSTAPIAPTATRLWEIYANNNSDFIGTPLIVTVQPVLSKHLRDNQNLLAKTGACLIQVHFYVFACFGNRIHACLKQVACSIEVVTKAGLTVFTLRKGIRIAP